MIIQPNKNRQNYKKIQDEKYLNAIPKTGNKYQTKTPNKFKQYEISLWIKKVNLLWKKYVLEQRKRQKQWHKWSA